MTQGRAVAPISGWVVDIARLRRDHRGRQSFSGREQIADLALPHASVPSGFVTHELDVDAGGTDVVVTGSASFEWAAQCRRCLEDVTGEGSAELREVYTNSAEGDEEVWPIVDDKIDVEPAVRESVLVSLPTSVLCKESCAGPESEYEVKVESEESEAKPDPRWAALDEITFD